MPPTLFEIAEFSEILMLRRKSFGLLLFVDKEASNLILKSLNLTPYSTSATTPLLRQGLFKGATGPLPLQNDSISQSKQPVAKQGCFVYFILSRLLYLAFSANLGLLCMPHPGMGPLV